MISVRGVARAAVVGTMVLMAARSATGSPLYCPETGHMYECVQEELSWYDAVAAAESRSYLGATGHLATVTSQAENEFITYSVLVYDPPIASWLGAHQAPGSAEPHGGWYWVTGEPWSYTNWRLGEPNNGGDYAGEDSLVTYGAQNPTSVGLWNDVYGGRSFERHFYVVEYPVPEPATLSLLALGGALALLRRRSASS